MVRNFIFYIIQIFGILVKLTKLKKGPFMKKLLFLIIFLSFVTTAVVRANKDDFSKKQRIIFLASLPLVAFALGYDKTGEVLNDFVNKGLSNYFNATEEQLTFQFDLPDRGMVFRNFFDPEDDTN